MIALLLAPVAQHPDFSGVLVVVGHHHAAFAIRAEVLARVEAERAGETDAARAPAVELGAMRLAGIFDHRDAVAVRDRQDSGHVRHLAVEMHRQDRLRPGRDRLLELVHVHGEGPGFHVDEHRHRAGVADRGDRRDERKRDGDDLVARSDAGRQEREVKRARARVHPDRLPGAAIGREVALEIGDELAEHELPALEDVDDGSVDLRLDALVLRFQIEKRNHTVAPAASSATTRPRSAMESVAADQGRSTRGACLINARRLPHGIMNESALTCTFRSAHCRSVKVCDKRSAPVPRQRTHVGRRRPAGGGAKQRSL